MRAAQQLVELFLGIDNYKHKEIGIYGKHIMVQVGITIVQSTTGYAAILDNNMKLVTVNIIG